MDSNMAINILLGVVLMLVCLAVQIMLLLRTSTFYFGHQSWIEAPHSLRGALVPAQVLTMLVLGNLAQAACWALLFYALGEFTVFGEAFYHSLVNFATLGYGDIVMSPEWRLLGPIEALNGVLMVGVNTGAIAAIVQDGLRTMAESHRR